MKYTTQIVKSETIEVDIDPRKVVEDLLEGELKKLNTFSLDGHDHSFLEVAEDFRIILVRVTVGYSYGHYAKDDEVVGEDVTSRIKPNDYNLLVSYKRVLGSLEKNNE